MDMKRRAIMRSAGALGILVTLGLITEEQALAANDRAAFDAKTFADAIKAAGGEGIKSAEINLVSPDIAENGAVVPVTVTSAIPKTEKIFIFVERNPNPLTAAFTISPDTEPSVQTRVKMGETSNIIALVMADGKMYSATKETKVTLGGCGG